jgi:hypothetical protein
MQSLPFAFLKRLLSWISELFIEKLSKPQASVICFVVAGFAKLSLIKYYHIVSNDRVYQIIAAKNWLKGLGFSINSVHVDDLSKEILEPLHGYPIGYSALLLPLSTFFDSLETASFYIDLISGILFLIVIRKILVQLKIPGYLVNYSILFHGFTLPIYIVQATPTDLLSATLCLLNVSLSISLIQKCKNAFAYGLLIGAIGILLGLLRYMYVPVLFILCFCYGMDIEVKERTCVFAGGFAFLSSFLAWSYHLRDFGRLQTSSCQVNTTSVTRLTYLNPQRIFTLKTSWIIFLLPRKH